MRCLLIAFCAVTLLAIPLSSRAVAQSEIDPVRARLSADVKEFEREMESSRKQLIEAIEALRDRVKKDRRLDVPTRLSRVEAITKELEAFQKTGNIPTLPALRKETIKYVRTVTNAHKKCLKEYAKAVDDYEETNNTSQTEKVRSELESFRSRKLYGDGYVYPGQYYLGSRAHGPVRGEYFSMKILETDGGKFSAIAYVTKDKLEYPVVGVAADGNVSAKMKGTNSKLNHTINGIISEDKMSLGFKGITRGGGRIRGSIQLKLTDTPNE